MIRDLIQSSPDAHYFFDETRIDAREGISSIFLTQMSEKVSINSFFWIATNFRSHKEEVEKLSKGNFMLLWKRFLDQEKPEIVGSPEKVSMEADIKPRASRTWDVLWIIPQLFRSCKFFCRGIYFFLKGGPSPAFFVFFVFLNRKLFY